VVHLERVASGTGECELALLRRRRRWHAVFAADSDQAWECVEAEVAWMFHTGDVSAGKHGKQRSGFETTPILVDGTLFLTTGFNRVIALNPETGTQRWSYDPKIDLTWDYGDSLVNRSVATWLDPNIHEQTGGLCRHRIFEATLDARLVALDAATGIPCPDFGENGQVSLRRVPRYMAGNIT
jgi:quinoprotein glucose dehydrogenase